MQYQLAAFDLDDTLLRADGRMSDATRNRLLAAQRAGLHIALASGRPACAMRAIARELQLSRYGGFLIPFNGAQIIRCSTGEQLYSRPLNREYQLWLYAKAQELGAWIHVYDGMRLLTPEANRYTLVESRLTGMRVFEDAHFASALPFFTPKVLLMQDPFRLESIERRISSLAAGRFSLCRSKPFFLECVHPAVSKGAALVQLCAFLHIPAGQTIAVGDSYNDLSMLHAAGVGVAMGNAPPAVRRQADLVTDTCSNDGAAKALGLLLGAGDRFSPRRT